ncbi:conserved hypothetical protein [Alkaliphilus metalliredigens QYMF]|uniref:HymD protein n=1 Tax=Alkaliphilus metalliredigens (strain QYMF) TaxID=293826 RepID=A6TKZ3_ALKMQ|nr:ECF transporter S component [Alkaliphilus metalliredigens]ABR46861.1 conserved hypothetical protein [Alkaliphilus metalliredigens QYMF]
MIAKVRDKNNYIARTGVLLALALVFQIGFTGFAQPVVGPLVNMVLIMSVIKVGVTAGMMIGCLTPLVAFLVGIMGLFPVVPFIMMGNCLFVVLFHVMRKNKGRQWEYIALGIAAIGKAGFLAFSIRYVVVFFVPQIPPPLIAALSLPQFYTSLVGGLMAIVVSRLFR